MTDTTTTTRADTLRALAERVEMRKSCRYQLTPKHDLSGQRFGLLTVVECAGVLQQRRRWKCLCDCGAEMMTTGTRLKSGQTKSCGCAAADRNRRVFEKHGHAPKGNKSREYNIWRDMHRRCNDHRRKDFKYYGALGVRVCERWGKFENFLKDMGECPTDLSIDRIDPFGNYEPDNCRWADRSTQMRNQRKHARRRTLQGDPT